MKAPMTTSEVCGDGATFRLRRQVIVAALLMLLIPSASAEVSAQPTPVGQATQVGSTPTPDPERVSLEKEKLRLERDKLQLETEKLRIENANSVRDLDDRRGWLNLLFGNLTILTTIIVGAWGFYRYFERRGAELRSHEEERFEGIVKSLGSEHAEERVSAAVLLPTFLSLKYARFHEQIFNLAAGHLRAESGGKVGAGSVTKLELPTAVSKLELRVTPPEGHVGPGVEDEHPSKVVAQSSELVPAPPGPLAQALANVLSKSYRLARDAKVRKREGDLAVFTRQSLNAAGVRLDGTYLANIDLRNAWFRQASLRGTTLSGALLTKAVLEGSDMSGARLNEAELVGANLKNVNFTGANLTKAGLDGADLDGANFKGASLNEIQMMGGTAAGANFKDADLTGARFEGVDFSPSDPHKWPVNLEDARSLDKVTFKDVAGLSEAQVSICRMRGAEFSSEAERKVPSLETTPQKVEPKALTKAEAKAEESVPKLLEALKSTDVKTHSNAARALGKMGQSVIPLLIEALKSGAYTNIADAFVEVGEEAIPHLIEVVKSSADHLVRRRASRALCGIGAGAVPELIKVLTAPEVVLRRRAAEALREIGAGAEGAVPELSAALKDADLEVRLNAAHALGKIGEEAGHAVPTLIECLKDSNNAVRRGAADALGEIGPRAVRAVPQLTEALEDSDEIVRMYANRALRKIGREKNT